jgi:phosphopantothenate synthetase
VHHVEAIQLAGDNGRSSQPRLVDALHQMANQSRFTCADLAGNYDKALALRQTVPQIRQRLAVRRALEIILRIGRQLERSSGQAVIFVVHLFCP